MPKEQAKAQLRALYSAEGRMEGSGFLDDVSGAIKAAYNEVADMDSSSWKKVKNVGDLDSEFWVTQHLPTDVQTYLDEHGEELVKQVIIRKAPVQAALEVALEAFSIGKWEEAKKKMGYDTMFHLSLLLNKNTVLEKLARINIGKVDNPPNAEFQVVTVKTPIPLKEVVNKTKAHMKGKFYPYDPFQNNCQDFVNGVLEANSDVFDYTADDKKFVKQSVDEMVGDLPQYLPKLARTITSLGGLTGGASANDLVTAPQLLDMSKEAYSYIGHGVPPAAVGEWQPVEETRDLVLYNKGGSDYILAVRGTKEFRDVLAWKPVTENKVAETDRYKDNEVVVRQWKKAHPGTWYGTGHSLGGAICDNLLSSGFLTQCMTFNPAVEPKFAGQRTNQRVYFQGDPLLALFGGLDPSKIVVSDPEPGWIGWLFGIDLSSHGLSNFDGLLDDVKLGGSLEDLVVALEGGAYAPRDLYTTAETRLPGGEARRKEQVRDLQNIEQGLRAVAHLDEKRDPLASFGARLMADDLFEHRTGENVDPGHNEATRTAFTNAFRSSRSKQMESLDLVESTMAKYGLTGKEGRQTAYKYLTGEEEPPKAAPVRAKSPAQLRKEAEEEDRLRREYEEARTAAEKKRVVEEAAALEKKKFEEEAARIRNEAYEVEREAIRQAQIALEKAHEAERERQQAERRKALEEEEARKKAARVAAEKEAEKAKKKKKKAAKKGTKEEGEAKEEAEEEKPSKQDPELDRLNLEIAKKEELISPSNSWYKEYDSIKSKYGMAVSTYLAKRDFYSAERAGRRQAMLRSFGENTDLAPDMRKWFKKELAQEEGYAKDLSMEEVSYTVALANWESYREWYKRTQRELKELEYEKAVHLFKKHPPDEDFREAAQANLDEVKSRIDRVYTQMDLNWEKDNYLKILEITLRRIEKEFSSDIGEDYKKAEKDFKKVDILRKEYVTLQEEFMKKPSDKLATEIEKHRQVIAAATARYEYMRRLFEDGEECKQLFMDEISNTKAKIAGMEKALKGKGKHSYLAQALGHLSVSKARLEELRRRRQAAYDAGNAALFHELNALIQTLAKPTIEAQKKDIGQKVESGTGKKRRKLKGGVGEWTTKLNALIAKWRGRVPNSVLDTLAAEVRQTYEQANDGTFKKVLKGVGAVAGAAGAAFGIAGLTTLNPIGIAIGIAGFGVLNIIKGDNDLRAIVKGAALREMEGILEDVGAYAQQDQLKRFEELRAKNATALESVKKNPHSKVKDLFDPKKGFKSFVVISPETASDLVDLGREGEDRKKPKYKWEAEPTGVDLHPSTGKPVRPPSPRPPRPGRPVVPPPPAELRGMLPVQIQAYYDAKREGKTEEQALEAARKATPAPNPRPGPMNTVLLQQLSPAELQQFYDIRREHPELTIRQAVQRIIQRRGRGKPKEGSVRKPYVGKVMKEDFMRRVEGRTEKEVRNLFNKAKRVYKAGGRTWSSVLDEVLGT